MEKLMQESEKNGAVIGVGNVLCSDDGIGVWLLKYLESSYIFPESVELIDGGTSGAALQNSITGKNWLLIIDAISVPGAPGEVITISSSDYISMGSDVKLSPHQLSFFDLIQFMNFTGTGAEQWSIIGIIPENTEIGTRISPSVEKNIGRAVETLIDKLNLKGIFPERVPEKSPPDYWWLR